MRKILMLLWVVVCCTLVNGQVSVRVVEYVPAPGQFTNQLPAVTAADDSVSVLQKAQTLLERGSLVSLGAWGGSITLHYAAGIYNHVGEYDFRVLGNAFTNSAEPGVIYVMKDENGNGIADDTWYEIAGSAHSSTETNRSYEIVYYKPSAEKEAQTGAVSDYIAWRDSEGGSGHVSKTTFHQQSYWPAWLGRDSLCIRATRLPSNARDVNGDGSYISFDAFDWGYADNHSNASEGSKIKLDWAVDDAGNGVELDVVHFVKVSTGVMACFGQTGEVSTEVSGLEVLAASSEVEHVQDDAVSVFMYANILSVTVSSRSTVQLFTVNGALVAQWDGVADVLQTDVNELNAGIYVVKVLSVHGANVKKIIKK